ncbi:PAS domain-containing protein [Streptomyces sp. NPDC014894]|uniref:PAS domain-containing protein n=1 Tax=Streptomyces sp. NPDC014894 TaxID=3364931 RepID=UPI0036FF6F92
MHRGVPPPRAQRSPAPGPIPLAAVVVDGDGLVSHWSAGARRLFGPAREDAVGRPALDLLPVAGALAPEGEYAAYDGGPGFDARLSLAAGRARLFTPGRERIDVIWWACPMAGPGPARLLVLAADAARFGETDAYGPTGDGEVPGRGDGGREDRPVRGAAVERTAGSTELLADSTVRR